MCIWILCRVGRIFPGLGGSFLLCLVWRFIVILILILRIMEMRVVMRCLLRGGSSGLMERWLRCMLSPNIVAGVLRFSCPRQSCVMVWRLMASLGLGLFSLGILWLEIRWESGRILRWLGIIRPVGGLWRRLG